jgi:hypothetical protein
MSGSLRLASVLAAAASLGFAALPASAADLYAPSWSGNDYDRHGYAEDYPDEPRSYGQYRDRRDGDDHYRYSAREYDCVTRRQVRHRLRRQGWFAFRGLEPKGRVLLVQARGRSGGLFDLTIDRCSGEVIEVRQLEGRRYDDRYAHETRRRWSSY